MKYEIKSEVINGKLIRNRNLILDALNALNGNKITITLQKEKKSRTSPQNRFYWGVVVELVRQGLKDAGHVLNTQDTHEMLKLRFLKEILMVNENTGEVVERIKSTSELTTSEMNDYISEIQIFASEYLGIIIPDPNEEITLNFE
jgi:hypothetical protein